MKHRLVAAIAGLAVTGAVALAGAVPAGADTPSPPPYGYVPGFCGPSNGSGNAAGGPGYAQYQGPPASEVAGNQVCG